MVNGFGNGDNDFMQPNNAFAQSGNNFNNDTDFMQQNNNDGFMTSKQTDDLLDDIMDGFTPPGSVTVNNSFNNVHQNNGFTATGSVTQNAGFTSSNLASTGNIPQNDDFMTGDNNFTPTGNFSQLAQPSFDSNGDNQRSSFNQPVSSYNQSGGSILQNDEFTLSGNNFNQPVQNNFIPQGNEFNQPAQTNGFNQAVTNNGFNQSMSNSEFTQANTGFNQAMNNVPQNNGFNRSVHNDYVQGNNFNQNSVNQPQQRGMVTPLKQMVSTNPSNFNQNHGNYGQNDFNSANNGGNAYTDDDILDSFNRDELTQSYESERLVQAGADTPVILAPQINNLPSGVSRYKAILSRQISQVFIVTGDRRSGKTRISMEIAKHFANQKIKTLYVDFDTEYKGSLMNFDISNFASCPPTVTSGLLQARSSTALARNVYRQAGIPFDSLLSLYDVNVPDEALKEVQIQLAYQAKSYGCIVIDCPMDKLYVMEEAMALATIYCCIPSDLGGMLSTFMRFSKIEPLDEYNRKKGNDAIRLSYKGIAYLYPRMQYLISQSDNKDNFSENCEYISELFSMDRDKYNWARCKVAGYAHRLPEALQAMI